MLVQLGPPTDMPGLPDKKKRRRISFGRRFATTTPPNPSTRSNTNSNNAASASRSVDKRKDSFFGSLPSIDELVSRERGFSILGEKGKLGKVLSELASENEKTKPTITTTTTTTTTTLGGGLLTLPAENTSTTTTTTLLQQTNPNPGSPKVAKTSPLARKTSDEGKERAASMEERRPPIGPGGWVESTLWEGGRTPDSTQHRKASLPGTRKSSTQQLEKWEENVAESLKNNPRIRKLAIEKKLKLEKMLGSKMDNEEIKKQLVAFVNLCEMYEQYENNNVGDECSENSEDAPPEQVFFLSFFVNFDFFFLC